MINYANCLRSIYKTCMYYIYFTINVTINIAMTKYFVYVIIVIIASIEFDFFIQYIFFSIFIDWLFTGKWSRHMCLHPIPTPTPQPLNTHKRQKSAFNNSSAKRIVILFRKIYIK